MKARNRTKKIGSGLPSAAHAIARKKPAKKVTVQWVKVDHADDNRGTIEQSSYPKKMTKKDVLAVVGEWFDAIGSRIDDYDEIHLFHVKTEARYGD